MGSYNVSCALSNMPIHEGESAKLVFLVERSSRTSLDATAFYQLLTPAFLDVKYTDYGRFSYEGSEITLKYLYELLEKHVIIPYNSTDQRTISSYDFSELFELINDQLLFVKPSYMDKICSEDEERFSETSLVFTPLRPRRIYFMAIKSSIIDKMTTTDICKDIPNFDREDVVYENLNLRQIGSHSEKILSDNEEVLKHLLISMHISNDTYSNELKAIGIDETMYRNIKNEITECLGDNYDDVSFFYRFILRTNSGLTDIKRTLSFYKKEKDIPNLHNLLSIIKKYDIDYKKAAKIISVICDVSTIDCAKYFYSHDIELFEKMVIQESENAKLLNGYIEWLYDMYHSVLMPSVYAGQEWDHSPHEIFADIVKDTIKKENEEYE
mgnify:CR=1 FL=1